MCRGVFAFPSSITGGLCILLDRRASRVLVQRGILAYLMEVSRTKVKYGHNITARLICMAAPRVGQLITARLMLDRSKKYKNVNALANVNAVHIDSKPQS